MSLFNSSQRFIYFFCFVLHLHHQGTKVMEEIIGVCGLEARGLVEGSSSPLDVETPSQDNMVDFVGLVSSEEERGETPGREDSNPDPLDGDLDPNAEKTKDHKSFG